MKSLPVLLLLLLVSTGFAAQEIIIPVPAPVSDDALLSAIAEVETGNNSAVVGRNGERTHLQIKRETWARYSRLPHSASARYPEETERVARAYLASIRARLQSRGLPVTPFFVAAAWNIGPNWRYLPTRTVDYADRVANLVQNSPAAPALPPAEATTPSPVIEVAPPPPRDRMAVVFEIPATRPPFRVFLFD